MNNGIERLIESLERLVRGRKRGPCEGVVYLALQEQLDSEGCPVCRLARRVEERLIWNILYERVNDPTTRSMIRESLGLCPYHAWLMVSIARRNPEVGPLGPAIIYEDMVSEAVDLLSRGEVNALYKRIRGECLVCRHVRAFEDVYVGELVDCIEGGGFLSSYKDGKSTLCLRHYLMVHSRLKSKRLKAELEAIQVEKLRSILGKIREFIRKHDYRVEESISPDEASAWIRAVEALKGYSSSLSIRSTP